MKTFNKSLAVGWACGFQFEGCDWNFVVGTHYYTNPHYYMTLETPDADDVAEECTCIISLLQKGYRHRRTTRAKTIIAGFDVYQVGNWYPHFYTSSWQFAVIWNTTWFSSRWKQGQQFLYWKMISWSFPNWRSSLVRRQQWEKYHVVFTWTLPRTALWSTHSKSTRKLSFFWECTPTPRLTPRKLALDTGTYGDNFYVISLKNCCYFILE